MKGAFNHSLIRARHIQRGDLSNPPLHMVDRKPSPGDGQRHGRLHFRIPGSPLGRRQVLERATGGRHVSESLNASNKTLCAS